MKKILFLSLLLFSVMGCSTFNHLIKKDTDTEYQPLLIGDQVITINENVEQAVSEGKIIEGMTVEMVQKSWGQPQNKIMTPGGLTLWEYNNSKLYFLEDVLISWEDKK